MLLTPKRWIDHFLVDAFFSRVPNAIEYIFLKVIHHF